MTVEILILFVNLVLILVGAEIFTNGVEVFAKRFSLTQAVAGSILAAMGTALPETILPLVAILLHKGEAGHSIGVGAILGAPFMLSTLAFFLIGLTGFLSSILKRREFSFDIEISTVKRDLIFFILMYSCGIFLPMVVEKAFIVVMLLIFGYVFYLYKTLKSSSKEIIQEEKLHFERFLERIPLISRFKSLLTSLQILIAVFVMIEGAQGFVKALQKLSESFNFDPLIFSLLVAPVATELPEKVNSIIWTLKGRDTLAIGNVTGAMVFQSTFPVAIGILFTEWNIKGYALLSACLVLFISLIILGGTLLRRRVPPFLLIFSGVFYILYIMIVLVTL
ncbi:MAG: sodium:calcium antiporter [Thermodesulfovibrio sp.]|nr:sodium:calcium antiporter [Thermodesulfovibrio sp.]